MHMHAERFPLMTSLSSTRKLDPAPSPPLISPWMRDRVICTPVVAILRSHLTSLASMTVFGTVMEHGPVYAVRATPLGTPVLSGPGQPAGAVLGDGFGELEGELLGELLGELGGEGAIDEGATVGCGDWPGPSGFQSTWTENRCLPRSGLTVLSDATAR